MSKLLDSWEEDTRRGDADAMCESFTPDMTFAIHDHIGARVENGEGDRDKMCAYLDKVVPLLAQKEKSVEVKREGFTVKRYGLHWLTADVSYTEHREITLDSGMHLKQVSEDHLTLVKTTKGLRVTRLESESRLVQ